MRSYLFIIVLLIMHACLVYSIDEYRSGQDLTGDDGPVSVPGISPATQELFWQHREQIDELDLAGYELHHTLDRRGGTTITIGDHRPHSDD